MRHRIAAVAFIGSVLLSQNIRAQSGSGLSNKKEFTVSVTPRADFISRLHYFGRTDSLQSSALVPSLTIKFGEGFYITGSGVFINNANRTLDYSLLSAGLGYRFGGTSGWAGNVYANKYFFSGRKQVQSAQQGDAGLVVSWLDDLLDINASAGVAFSGKTDFFLSAGIDHAFRFANEKQAFVIIPSITANAGTQNYTYSYISKKNILIVPVVDEQLTKSARSFRLLSYEASVPLIYVRGKFSASLTPGYVLPQNLVTVAGRPDLSEHASGLFYCNAGISFTFGKN